MKIMILARCFQSTGMITLIALLISPQVTPADSHPVNQNVEPSLQETLNWLREKLPDYALDSSGKPLMKSVHIDRCKIFYDDTNPETGKIRAKVTLTLADIRLDGPGNYTVPGSNLQQLEFYSTSAKAIMFNDSDGKTRYRNWTRIFFKDRETAQRVTKALYHAIQLCKKKEPF